MRTKNNPLILNACLRGLLLTGLLLSSVAQAAVDVKCSDDTDGDCISEIANGGLWNSFGFGQCFYILPTATEREEETPVGPTVGETEENLNVCIGGLDPLNLTTNNDIDVRIFKGGEGSDPFVEESNAFAWSNVTADVADGAAQFIPSSCTISDFDSTSPNRRNGTFDNGDRFDPDDPRFVVEPMSAEFTLGSDVSGDATLSYYFQHGKLTCRALDWNLKVNGSSVKSGRIADVKDGKYLVFNLTGLEGDETIRLDVVNPFQPGGGTPDGCPVDLIPGVNSVISGVFISGTSVCTPPELAALGDRVWEDLDADGIQDCIDGGAGDPDFPADGIIGNAGDAGPECDAGIPDVPVNLLAGNCVDSLGQQATTDMDGFYLFDDLDPGDYCVEFIKPPVDFCDTDGFDLGEPQFTSRGSGADDAIDSDADTTTGVSGLVTLSSGETDITVDAGIICPAKIGDRVWSDDNEDGLQDGDEEGVPDVIVKLFECTDGQAIVDNDKLVRITTTDDTVDEMNYMFGAEPDFDLEPGEYFVQFMKPDGTEFTTPKVGTDDSIDSDCLPPNGISSCVTLGSRGINLDRDCGLIPPPPPECDLELDKTCRVETPPVSGDLECEAKIAASVLEYIGAGTPSVVTVEGKNKKASVASSFVSGILTVDARPNDLGAKMTITTDGVAEVIHTSCSTPYVAGLPAPLDNPKGGPSANWLVLSFVDKNGGSASVPDDGNGDGMFTDNCTFTQSPLPSCDTVGKPNSLTFRYTSGACPGDNDQGSKSDCSGSVDGTQVVTISVNTGDDYTVSPAAVSPGETFTVARSGQDFKSNTDIDLSNSGGTQQNEVHTSCSAPLAVGDEFGAITLVGINGQTGGAEVTYQYVVTNNGDPLTGINVTDDVLGDIAGPIDLGTGESETFTALTKITGTTVNTGTASALLGGEVCSASDSTTVTVVEPPVTGGECDGKVTNLTLKNLGDDAQVRVDQKKDDVTVFDEFVPSGGEFSFSGEDKKGTLGTEIKIFVNDILNTKIHTSCSQPIGPGLVSGSFEVISGDSRNGGPLPPI